MFLAADIGGTKTLVALGDGAGVRFQRRYSNDAHGGVAHTLAAFLDDATAAGFAGRVTASCLALAGPVAPGARCARLTNRSWAVDADELARSLPLGAIRLLNDFAASAAGIATLAAHETLTLQAGRPEDGAVRLALGPGTGLGVAACFDHGVLLASEGGHVGFAPQDETQDRLLEFLRTRLGAVRHVSIERVVSGAGLSACYDYCAARPAQLDPAEVSARALGAADPDAVRALDLFLAIFGAFAGDMALCFLARGGVFLMGGIVPKILSRLRAGAFLSAFNDKAEHAELVSSIPVVAVLAEDLGLRGALATASTGA